ncbi:hypothetical protein BC834DRAFT_877390 [Gloeopeniophorella convolvens]|nr:hypothetical protein BC834DRAFT_877390 [Gloeopeniophorella convolvens]
MAAVEETPGSLRGAQEAYVEQKDRILGGLDSTQELITGVRSFNKESWTIRYPKLSNKPVETTTVPSPKRRGVRRSLSFADDPSSETDVILEGGLTHSLTLTSIVDAPEVESDEPVPDSEERLIPESEAPDFQVFRLDLNLGAPGSSAAAGALVSQLEKASIANLIDERMATSSQHIDKLRVRVQDTSSKVLVTGDLNAGKSTFVNALLRREVMPVDQQPCTTAFCEVHDYAENDNVEEVHIVKDVAAYSAEDESTFKRASLSDLDDIMADGDEKTQQVLKLYLNDTRPLHQSLVNNGVVDISLIDAPGLNRDSLKTTALFTRQEEIDVVVFVVSAENHLTESAQNFLKNASNEKAYLFIVVNKYDQIKNKEKCRRMVLEQIKTLSPRTYDDAEDLVHFVDSLLGKDEPSFEDLEASLRSFVLVKRAKSKLTPASTYLSNLLADIELLVSANAIVAQAEAVRARSDLEAARPVLERMKNSRQAVEDGLESIEEDGVRIASNTTQRMLMDALDRIGLGLPGVDSPSIALPSYPGLLGLWDYARDVRRTLLASLDVAVKMAEDEARVATSVGVQQVRALGEDHLPANVERSRRVFVPEAMFGTRRARDGKRKSRRHSVVVAGGSVGLGIGLASRPELVQPTFFDLLDVPHHFWVYFGDKEDSEEAAPSALGIVSVGVGALTMIGGQAVGLRALVEGVVRVADVMSNENARKWAAPVLGAVVIGTAAYFVLELPASVPRTVGRRIRQTLVKPAVAPSAGEELFVDAHVTRVGRETRKVLRLASWELRQQFSGAMDECTREVRSAEDMEHRAMTAVGYFTEVQGKTADIRAQAGLVSMA